MHTVLCISIDFTHLQSVAAFHLQHLLTNMQQKHFERTVYSEVIALKVDVFKSDLAIMTRILNLKFIKSYHYKNQFYNSLYLAYYS